MDSEITYSRKRTQKWTQNWAPVAVSCPDCCFLFRKRAREGAAPGASGQGNSFLFESGGTPFFEPVFQASFFTQTSHFWQKMSPKSTQFRLFRDPFLRKSTKTVKCVWTAQAWTDCIWAHPVEGSLRPKKHEKKLTLTTNTYFYTKYTKYRETRLQKVSKWMREFWWWRLLGHLWRPNLFFDTKNASKVLQKWSQGCKMDPQVLQKLPQGCKMDPKTDAKVVNVTPKSCSKKGPGGLREALK